MRSRQTAALAAAAGLAALAGFGQQAMPPGGWSRVSAPVELGGAATNSLAARSGWSWQASNALLRAQMTEMFDARKKLLEHETGLRQTNDACRALAAEIDALRKQVAEREEKLLEQIAADAEWQRLKEDLAQRQRGTEAMRRALQQAAMHASGQAAMTNRPMLPTRRLPPRDFLPRLPADPREAAGR